MYAHQYEPQEVLHLGLKTLRLDLSVSQVGQLLTYVTLIQKWNKTYNITAIQDETNLVVRHLLDCLAIIQPLQRKIQQMLNACPRAAHPRQTLRVLDVGSGAGLPGVVMAICCPAIHVDCVDTVAKKTAFIQHVACSIGLKNLQAFHTKAQSLQGTYQVVCSRALGSLFDFVTWTSHAIDRDGMWMAMKGKPPVEEISCLPTSQYSCEVEPLHVPELDEERCLVWIRQLSLGSPFGV